MDTVASAKGRLVSLPLAGYFPDNKGPNEHRLDSAGKQLTDLGEKVAKQLQMQMVQVSRGAVVEDTSLMPDVNYEKKVAALARARVMLANSRAPFSLSVALVPPAIQDVCTDNAGDAAPPALEDSPGESMM